MLSVCNIDVDCIVLHILQVSLEIEQCDNIILAPIDIMTSIKSSERLNTMMYSYVYEDIDVFGVDKLKCRNLVVVWNQILLRILVIGNEKKGKHLRCS